MGVELEIYTRLLTEPTLHVHAGGEQGLALRDRGLIVYFIANVANGGEADAWVTTKSRE